MSYTFRRAVREAVPLILGVAGPSGSGKTYSALRLASGMANGKPFVVLDTEAGRAKHYADQFVFDHADLRPPFRPKIYMDAIVAADEAGYPVIVVDSCSHEHAGDGGLLDFHEDELERMAGDDYKKREACKMAAWVKPKSEHKHMVSRLLQVRAHIILAFRAEQKVEMVKGDNGRMEIQPKKIASGFSDWIPICEKNLLYELTASFLLTPDAPGIPKPIKLQQQMREFVDLKKPLDESAGQKMAAWAAGGAPQTVNLAPPATKPVSTLPSAKGPSEYVLKVGRQKNQPIVDQHDDNLTWALNYYLDKIRTVPTSNYLDEWQEAVLEIRAEMLNRYPDAGNDQ